jgi:hypothetical protein
MFCPERLGNYTFVPIAKKDTKNKGSSCAWTKMSREDRVQGPGFRVQGQGKKNSSRNQTLLGTVGTFGVPPLSNKSEVPNPKEVPP